MGNSRRSALFSFGWTGRRVIAVHNRVSQGSEQYESGVWQLAWGGHWLLSLAVLQASSAYISRHWYYKVEIHYRYSRNPLPVQSYSTVRQLQYCISPCR